MKKEFTYKDLIGFLKEKFDPLKKGYVYPKVATIATLLNVSERTIQRWQRRLVEEGLIKIKYCIHIKKYGYRNVIYFLDEPVTPKRRARKPSLRQRQQPVEPKSAVSPLKGKFKNNNSKTMLEANQQDFKRIYMLFMQTCPQGLESLQALFNLFLKYGKERLEFAIGELQLQILRCTHIRNPIGYLIGTLKNWENQGRINLTDVSKLISEGALI